MENSTLEASVLGLPKKRSTSFLLMPAEIEKLSRLPREVSISMVISLLGEQLIPLVAEKIDSVPYSSLETVKKSIALDNKMLSQLKAEAKKMGISNSRFMNAVLYFVYEFTAAARKKQAEKAREQQVILTQVLELLNKADFEFLYNIGLDSIDQAEDMIFHSSTELGNVINNLEVTHED